VDTLREAFLFRHGIPIAARAPFFQTVGSRWPGSEGLRHALQELQLMTETRSRTKSKHPRPQLLGKILVAVDAGPLSDHAVSVALQFAERFGAQIELVHAFDSSGLLGELSEDPREVAVGNDAITRATGFVIARVNRVLGAANGKRKRAAELVRVIPGRPGDVILERARKQRSDLIVLGALRRKSNVDFGGTARTVLAGAPCPVWVQPGPRREIRHILVPVDFSEESRQALTTACRLAVVYGARITALHVFDLPRMAATPWMGYGVPIDIAKLRQIATEEFEKFLDSHDWQGVRHASQFADGSPSELILRRSNLVDLVVMGTHGRTGLSAVLLGSVAYRVLKRTTRPVLVVHKRGRKFAIAGR
jgi:nucleotide-binding universal stress UspA family protein